MADKKRFRKATPGKLFMSNTTPRLFKQGDEIIIEAEKLGKNLKHFVEVKEAPKKEAPKKKAPSKKAAKPKKESK